MDQGYITGEHNGVHDNTAYVRVIPIAAATATTRPTRGASLNEAVCEGEQTCQHSWNPKSDVEVKPHSEISTEEWGDTSGDLRALIARITPHAVIIVIFFQLFVICSCMAESEPLSFVEARRVSDFVGFTLQIGDHLLIWIDCGRVENVHCV